MIFIIIIVVVCLFVMLNIAYKRTNRYKKDFNDIVEIKDIETFDKLYDIVAIGSSQARYAYDFSGLKIDGANLSARPQTLQLDSFLITNILNKIKKGGTVIISVCIMEFFLYRFKNNNNYEKYINVLTKTQFKQIEGQSLYKTYMKNLVPLLFYPWEARFILLNDKPKNVFNINRNLCDSQEKLDRDADYWISLWNNEFNINIPDTKIPLSAQNNITANIKILQRLIDTCIAASLRPVLVIPPITNILLSRFDKKFIHQYLISILTEQIKRDVAILNYLDNEMMKNISLYMNSFFLNKTGRKEFTKLLFYDLYADII